MTAFPWKIEHGGEVVYQGVIEASSEREAFKDVLRQTGVERDKCYRVRVGGLVSSAYGDEFEDVAQEVGDELGKEEWKCGADGYVHASPAGVELTYIPADEYGVTSEGTPLKLLDIGVVAHDPPVLYDRPAPHYKRKRIHC